MSKPGGRVDTDTVSGEIEISGAVNDIRAHAVSGEVRIQGNPGTNYWNAKTISGEVEIDISASAKFQLSAGTVSGSMKTDSPIVVDEQERRTMRAHLGNDGGHVEVQTVSGDVHVNIHH